MSLTDGPARQSPAPTRWSLRSLFFATAIAAFFAAALADPEGVGLVAPLVALGSAICAGVVCFCPGQPFARGYLAAGGVFLLFAFFPPFWFITLFPAAALMHVALWLVPDPAAGDPLYGEFPSDRQIALLIVGHSLWTILFGLLGGFVASCLASRPGGDGRWLPHELTAAYRKGGEADPRAGRAKVD
ncbi:MAG: hypothetical protein U0836_10595 [Pirellulales bacterium]